MSSTSPKGENGSLQAVAGDIDADGSPDVVVKATNRLFVFRADGSPIAGFPRAVDDRHNSGTTAPFPAIGDVDGDGRVDLVAVAAFDRVHVFQLSASFLARELDWPMFQHDALHSSRFETRCGDGARAFGEECDDGNLTDGDTCSSTCVSLICGAALAQGCHPPLDPAVGVLQLKDRSKSSHDRLTWRWAKGSLTQPADFGDPTRVDHYAVCLYDESNSSPHLLFRAFAPAGGTCSTNGAPCWRGRGIPRGSAGYRYLNRAATSDGLASIDLTPGGDGRASVVVRGKGERLSGRVAGLPAPPLGLPLRAQLQTQNGSCWEAAFTSAGAKTNRAGLFIGQPD